MTRPTQAVQFPNGEVYTNESGTWTDSLARGECVLLKGKAAGAAMEAYRRKQLLELIQPGDTLTAVCTNVGRSGTNRYQVFIPSTLPDGKPCIRNITGMVADLAGFQLKNHEIVMGGSGYSKTFQIGYSLGLALWPNGTPEPHGTRNGEPDSNGGYAIAVNGF